MRAQCMPLYHSAASCLAFCSALFTGATAALGRRFSTKTFWKEVRETKSTVIQYVGETCRYLTVAPPEIDPVTGENLDKKHCVRAAMGNGLRPDVWDRFKDRFGIDVSHIESSAVCENRTGADVTWYCRPSTRSTPPPKAPRGSGTSLATLSPREPSGGLGCSPAPLPAYDLPLCASTTRPSFRGGTRRRVIASVQRLAKLASSS